MTKVLDQTNVSELFKISAGNMEALQALTEEFRKRIEIETTPPSVEPKAKAASAAASAKD